MQKLVVLVAMLMLLLAISVPALATGNNQNAITLNCGGSGCDQGGFADGGFTEGGFVWFDNDIQQTAESGEFSSTTVVGD